MKTDIEVSKFFIVILILYMGVGLSTSVLSNSNGARKDLFLDYLKCFNEKSLPIKLNRTQVLALEDLNNSLTEIDTNLHAFVPAELKKNFNDSKFKGLYVLPKKYGKNVVLLLHGYVDQYEANVFKLYLVIYDDDGDVTDYQEVAGFILDVWEAYLSIDENYDVRKKTHNYKINRDSKYAILVETNYIYRLSAIGLINEQSKFSREGFFDEDSHEYKFMKNECN
ncbi:hypothetical protein EYV94_27980 [Puteibacter caeruleilacunae]|nr:hypothetical protein EYV94_27980 [Puteibacter caeruleilacunae]